MPRHSIHCLAAGHCFVVTYPVNLITRACLLGLKCYHSAVTPAVNVAGSSNLAPNLILPGYPSLLAKPNDLLLSHTWSCVCMGFLLRAGLKAQVCTRVFQKVKYWHDLN